MTFMFGKQLDTAITDFIQSHHIQLRSLNFLEKYSVLHMLSEKKSKYRFGWVQLSSRYGTCFLLGVFEGWHGFRQIAVVDRRGHVYIGDDHPDQLLQTTPVMVFLRRSHENNGEVACFDPFHNALRLATWECHNNRYSLRDFRAPFTEDDASHLDFRSAIALSFFGLYFFPLITHQSQGYGANRIVYHLMTEAPISALRSIKRELASDRHANQTLSGLEQYFLHLIKEAGSLSPSLEARHGREALTTTLSQLSNLFVIQADQNLSTPAILNAFSLEASLNRFANIVEMVYRLGQTDHSFIEQKCTEKIIALLDEYFLKDPGLIALPSAYLLTPETVRRADGREVASYVSYARRVAHDIGEQARHQKVAGTVPDDQSEWLYRQAFSRLIHELRIPFRFDVDFQSYVYTGEVSVTVTTAGDGLLPHSFILDKPNDTHVIYQSLLNKDRERLAADYDLRLGIILAALAFGINSHIHTVTLYIDRMGLEISNEKTDLANLLINALADFGVVAHDVNAKKREEKGNPKDGDTHGEPGPSLSLSPVTTPIQEPSSDIRQQFDEIVSGLKETNVLLQEESPSLLLQQHMEAVTQTMVAVQFTRRDFLRLLRTQGLTTPRTFYSDFNAVMTIPQDRGFIPIDEDAEDEIPESECIPPDSQEEPELLDHQFSPEVARIVGTNDTSGLAIQRDDLLTSILTTFETIRQQVQEGRLPATDAAHRILDITNHVGDPELIRQSQIIIQAIIDHTQLPTVTLTSSHQLDQARLTARSLLLNGEIIPAIQSLQTEIDKQDTLFSGIGRTVPRYFNSYAERVIYNRLFKADDETTVLIPDSLFYAHMEIGMLLVKTGKPQEGIAHLNKAVAYAPSYPLVHLQQSIQFALIQDWSSAQAACLNALRVAYNYDDAAYAYYRYAYAAWMLGHFDRAAAAYILSDAIHPNGIPALAHEYKELLDRAASQRISLPQTVSEAINILTEADIPIWPHTEVATIIRQASRAMVDDGLFVPARTLALATARMDTRAGKPDAIQTQFLRSMTF